MSAQEHTPGPWTWDGEPHSIIVWCGRDKRVAFLMTSDGPTEANARLIAAAPDMLEMLKYWESMLAGNIGPLKGQLEMVRAVIAKAGAS